MLVSLMTACVALYKLDTTCQGDQTIQTPKSGQDFFYKREVN